MLFWLPRFQIYTPKRKLNTKSLVSLVSQAFLETYNKLQGLIWLRKKVNFGDTNTPETD